MAKLTSSEQKYLYSKGVDATSASPKNIAIAKAYTANSTPVGKNLVYSTGKEVDEPIVQNKTIGAVYSNPLTNTGQVYTGIGQSGFEQKQTTPVTPTPQIQQQVVPQQPLYQAPATPDTTAQRQQILDQMRQRLGIQKQSQSEAIMKSAEQAKRDIQSQYLQGKAGELERLVNQGLASGMQGAEQSGQARNEILQRQLSSENQANAVTTQAQGDITALDRQYNDLIAQGDIEGAKMAIDDAWQKYNAQVSQGQFGATMNQNQSQFDTSNTINQGQFDTRMKVEQDQINYNREQDELNRQDKLNQDAITNALNAKQITLQEAESRRRILESDRNYKLDVLKTKYSIGKPYYSPKTGKGGGGDKVDLSIFGIPN